MPTLVGRMGLTEMRIMKGRKVKNRMKMDPEPDPTLDRRL
jgi:hypothetical protein